MSDDLKLPELLAPAGTIEAGLTAFDAGADAVYAGLPRFNARERGQNFTFEQLSKLIGYAHGKGRRVYVTLNTLLKEQELPEVVEILARLAVIRPDAVIVQDLGLLRVLRRHFPELEIHASTQMALHNSAGLRVAERLGVSRVILERQTTFEEIAAMRSRSDMELEVFVHGALCCSRSGLCLFSSWMGGWSGNRGKCKQPCRRRYHSSEGNGFFFSPGDLYALEDLPALKKLGVAGLKIEGRLRRPDYVRRVVSAYRMMLDAAPADAPGLIKEARGLLSGALGRKWHRPFRGLDDFKHTIRHEVIGTSGLLCGKVVKVAPKSGAFAVELTRHLYRYDTIRVQPKTGDEGPSITIKNMSVGRKKQLGRATKGQTCWIESDKPVETGSLVFKTGSATADLSDRVAALPPARATLDLQVRMRDGSMRVETSAGSGSWETPADLSPARNRPLTADSVIEQLRKTRSEKFALGTARVDVEEGVFIPAGALKRLRRAFWEWADESISVDDVQVAWAERVAAFATEREQAGVPDHEAPVESVVRLTRGAQNPVRNALTASDISEITEKTDEILLPDFCSELELPWLEKKVARLIDGGARRFRVTSLFGFALLPDDPELKISSSFPIPVCNSMAVAALRELGASKVMAWVELEKGVLKELGNRWGGALEVMTYGRLPILTTRLHIPAKGRVADGRGAGFRVEREGGLTNLYPDKAFSIPIPKRTSTFVDLTHAALGERATSDYNYSRELV